MASLSCTTEQQVLSSSALSAESVHCDSMDDPHQQQPLSESQASTVICSNNPIRHAGRALVRGKFRRVWRPRHLEVWDNGLVRYYEVPIPGSGGGSSTLDAFVNAGILDTTTSSSTTPTHDNDNNNNEHPHAKIPKCTLAIHHARIIDVTTLRDMHVGLPRGSFGFLFHGQQIDDGEDQQQQLDQGQGHDQHPEDLFSDGMQLLSMGQCQGNANLATPRDFLCAVNSLEEAQSWVIALQWAASMSRDAASLQYGSVGSAGGGACSTTASTHSLPHDEGSSWQTPQNHRDGDSLSMSSPQRQQQHLQIDPASPPPTTSPKTPKQSPQSAKSAAGKMIVTKVVGYTLVRLETWKWEIAYQIQVLLVMPTSSSPVHNQQQPQAQQQVQEWSILRTAQDMAEIIDKLRVPLPAATSQKVQEQMKRIAELPTLQQQQSQRKGKKKTTKKKMVPLKELARSIAVVDSVLRSFCMEAGVVNSPSMKRFLGLLHNQQQQHQQSLGGGAESSNNKNSNRFWTFHCNSAVLCRPKRTVLQQSIDQFVKQWLQQPKRPKETAPSLRFQLLCWFLRLPQPTTTYAGVLLLSLFLSGSILPMVNRWIEKYHVVPYIAIRLDALILSWCLAAGIGKVLGGQDGGGSSSSSRRRLSSSSSPSKSQQPSPVGTPRSSPAKSTGSNGDDAMTQHRTVATPNKSLMDDEVDSQDVVVEEEDEDMEDDDSTAPEDQQDSSSSSLSSPLPKYDADKEMTESCWSTPNDNIFHVRGPTYLTDRVKVPSGGASFTCQGVDMWISEDNPERHIARHPSVLGGALAKTDQDMFLVNFLLPFGNFVAYFSIPPLEQFANPQLADVWTRFVNGNQQYRDARLKLLPSVIDGPWIVRAAVPGTSPALLGKVIPLQYFFTQNPNGRSIYEVDVIITASSIAKGILSVVKGHAKSISIAFAFIIEAAEEHELPETVLASFQIHSLHLEDCPLLPSMPQN